MTDISTRRWQTPIGAFDIHVGTNGICGVRMPDGLISALEPHVSEQLQQYFDGQPTSLSIDLGTVTSPLAQRTLAKLLEIPYGEVRSYAWVAREVGNPRAIRAVASAVARNPVPVLVPCHRVVRTDGHIGEFSLGGPNVKHDLLRHEGVDIERLESLARRNVRFVADKETNVFHLPSCRKGPAPDSPTLLELRTVSEATETLLDPCPRCRPV